VLKRNSEVEEQAGHEQEVTKTAPSYSRYDQAGNDECGTQDWNATVDRFAEMRMDSIRLSSFAFR
jgi:hypothetical protein